MALDELEIDHYLIGVFNKVRIETTIQDDPENQGPIYLNPLIIASLFIWFSKIILIYICRLLFLLNTPILLQRQAFRSLYINHAAAVNRCVEKQDHNTTSFADEVHLYQAGQALGMEVRVQQACKYLRYMISTNLIEYEELSVFLECIPAMDVLFGHLASDLANRRF